MLKDSEREKLCQGRIIYAEVYDSREEKPAGPHYAVILDSDDRAKTNTEFNVVVISHNEVIDPDFLMPVPPYTGLTGKLVGSWTTKVHELGIKEVRQKIVGPELEKVL